MKILVTGSSGTIGTRLCERLLAEKIDVHGADWRPNEWQPAVNDITTIADLRDAKAVATLPKDVDIIVHLAANARVYDLVQNPPEAFDNMQSTFNVLEFARTNGIPKVIFASSRECYGNIDAKTLTEDMARIEECESPYTASKITGEALMQAYRRCYNMDVLIYRFSNVYGMYDNSNRVVPLFIRQAKANEKLTVFGKDKELDFTYIDDAVDGIVKGIEKFDAVKNETFNIAFGEGTKITAVAEAIKELTGSDCAIEVGESRTGEITYYIADISKAKKMLGFDPKTSFTEGIKKSVEWYSKHM